MTRDDFARAFQQHRLPILATALALFTAIVFTGLGVKARRAAAPFTRQVRLLQTTADRIEEFKRGYQPAQPEEALRWNATPEALSLGIPRSRRLTLAQFVSSQAEAGGLRDVRVRFALPDSAMSSPPRMGPDGTPIPLASYTLSVEFDGGFVDALTFVNSLPATVALERFRVSKATGGSHYVLSLAVYETPDAKRPA